MDYDIDDDNDFFGLSETYNMQSIIKYFNEKRKEHSVIKFFDKISFFLGVMNLLVTQFIFVQYPQYFYIWFSIVIPLLVLYRYIEYKKNKWQYFLIDFCYFANVLCFVGVYLFPTNQLLFEINFAFSNGLLLFAILTWRNSLVFHSIDKMTSIYIHLFPSLLMFCLKWRTEFGTNLSMDYYRVFTLSIMYYCIWQASYFIKTELIDKKKLDNDCEIQTSLRWLSKDTKNFINKFVLVAMRKLQLMKPDEIFDCTKLKTKIIFIIMQFAFTVITLIPIPFIFNNFYLHILYLTAIFSMSVYNGAEYYIDVFAFKYMSKFE